MAITDVAGTAVVAAVAVATADGIISWDAVITGSVVTIWLTVTLAGTDVWPMVTFAEELDVFTTMA